MASLQAVAGIQNLLGNYQLTICDGDDHGKCAMFVVTIGAVGTLGADGSERAGRTDGTHGAYGAYGANRTARAARPPGDGNACCGAVFRQCQSVRGLRQRDGDGHRDGADLAEERELLRGGNTYADANEAAAGLAAGQCGLTDSSSAGDWRLPTKAEWEATIARAEVLGCKQGSPGGPPSLTNDPGTGCLSAGPTSFTGVESRFYWSSSANEVTPVNAWSVGIVFGIFTSGFSKVVDLFVWPVRGGQ